MEESWNWFSSLVRDAGNKNQPVWGNPTLAVHGKHWWRNHLIITCSHLKWSAIEGEASGNWVDRARRDSWIQGLWIWVALSNSVEKLKKKDCKSEVPKSTKWVIDWISTTVLKKKKKLSLCEENLSFLDTGDEIAFYLLPQKGGSNGLHGYKHTQIYSLTRSVVRILGHLLGKCMTLRIGS